MSLRYSPGLVVAMEILHGEVEADACATNRDSGSSRRTTPWVRHLKQGDPGRNREFGNLL